MEQKLKHGNYNIQLQNDEYLPDLPNLPPLLNLPNAFGWFLASVNFGKYS